MSAIALCKPDVWLSTWWTWNRRFEHCKNNSFTASFGEKNQYLTFMTSFPFDPNAGQIFATFSSRFSFLQNNKETDTYLKFRELWTWNYMISIAVSFSSSTGIWTWIIMVLFSHNYCRDQECQWNYMMFIVEEWKFFNSQWWSIDIETKKEIYKKIWGHEILFARIKKNEKKTIN